MQCKPAELTKVKGQRADSIRYVHCSGSIFVMIPDVKSASSVQISDISQNYWVEKMDGLLNYRIVSGKDGFLWAWNFMLTKKWRSQVTGDDPFQDKMHDDFHAFCSNRNDRLKIYWQSFKQAAMSPAPSLENLATPTC